MSAPPDDELPVLGGVWVGAEPPPAPAPPKPRPPRRGPVLIGASALVLAGGAAGYFTGPQPFGLVLGVAVGLACSGSPYLMLTRPPRLPEPLHPAADAAPRAEPLAPIPVVYKPIPLAPSPAKAEAEELEATLLRMCNGDAKLFERLVEHERQHHPRKPRREYIRLAIEHFWGGRPLSGDPRMISANVLGAASAVWCGLVVALCTGSGFAIGRLPPWVQAALPWAVLGGTGALILANLAAVLAHWLRPGDRAAALPSMALVQMLFGVLFIGVHGVLGPGHFRHPSAPGPEDWAAFAAAHAVRGADALDILEDYPLGIEAIRPNSDLVRSLLVAFNLVNGLVVLELIGRLVRQVRLALVGHLPHQFGVLIARALTKGTIVVAGLAAALIALLALFGDPGPNDAPAWVGGLVAGGLVLLMVVLYFAERFLAAWGDRKYGRMLLEVAEPHSVTGFKGNLRLLVVVVGSVWATSWSALAVCAAIVGLDYGLEQHGAEAVGRWAAVRALQAADVADVMILFSIKPYELDDFRFRTPLALFIRAVAVLTLSAVVAGLTRWWTRAPNGDDGERLRVSFRGWIGLVLGVLLGCGIVALARVSSNW